MKHIFEEYIHIGVSHRHNIRNTVLSIQFPRRITGRKEGMGMNHIVLLDIR